MSVSKGSLYRRKETRNWFIKFYVDGRIQRESTGTSDRVQAERILRRRIDDARRGLHAPSSERITFAEMKDELLRNYEFKQNRTDPRPRVKRLEGALRWSARGRDHLRAHQALFAEAARGRRLDGDAPS